VRAGGTVGPVIEELLPDGVSSAEVFGDSGDPPVLAEEEPAVSQAVPSRRREFATGRWCARRAMADAGIPPVAIPSGDGRAPVWPDGVIGSITHCAGYRAAAVARAGALTSLGIDAEPHAPLPAGVLTLIGLPDELRAIGENDPAIAWDRLLFSAKESVYKAWYPLERRWLGFEQARVALSPDGTFTARILIPAGPAIPADGFRGRWLARDGLLLTAITVPADVGGREPGRV
jgi:4'-phosphopantetheinyl transferase EntD